MTNLWDEATRDYDAERDSMLRSAAKITTARWWPFLAEASTERSFGHRLAVVKGDVLAALREAGVTSARFQEEALEGLAEDFRVLHASRREAAAAEHVVCPDCNGIGAVPAGGWEDEDDVDNGLKQCPTCKGEGEVPARTAVRRTANRPGSTQRGARALRGSTVTWADGSRTGTIVELAPLDSPPHPVKGRWGDVVTERTRAVSKDYPAKEIEACWVSSEGQMVWASVHVPTMKVLYSVETAQQVFSSRKQASGSGWTGMDAIDEAGLFAGQCAQGSPNCNWGWAKDGKGREVYRCSVHGTEQAVSHTRESTRKTAASSAFVEGYRDAQEASRTGTHRGNPYRDSTPSWEEYRAGKAAFRAGAPEPSEDPVEEALLWSDDMDPSLIMAGSKGWPEMPVQAAGPRAPDVAKSRRTASLTKCAACGGIATAGDQVECLDCGEVGHTATRKEARFENIVVGDRVTLKARGVPDLADLKMRNGNPAKATDWIVEALVRLDDYMADSGLSHGEDAYEMVENWLKDRGHDFPFLDRPTYVNDTMLAKVISDGGNEMVFPVSALMRASEPPMDGQKALPGMSRVR